MQTVIFISDTKPDTYPIIDNHYSWHGIHTKLTFEQFSEIYHNKKPYAIYTFGNNNIWNYLPIIFELRKKWVHLHTLPTNLDVIPCVFAGVIKHEYDSHHPLLSVISSTYNSKEKIQRPWTTLRNQTYTNWEWIIWDDSEDTKTYENLLEMQKKDLRMRVYRAPKHSGLIGEMKRLAAGVAYGSLKIIPGSHRWPTYEYHNLKLPHPDTIENGEAVTYREYETFIQSLIENSGVDPYIVKLKKGQALIWAANMLHGGSNVEGVADLNKTRLTQAIHYFFGGCEQYYHPMFSEKTTAKYATKWCNDTNNIKTYLNEKSKLQ